MFKTKSGRSFGNPQIGRAIDKGEGGMKHVGSGKSEPSREGHPHDSALAPHPKTGVTKVEIHHKGEGRYETHTHHGDGGEPIVEQHGDSQSALDHAQAQLPPEGMGEMEGDEPMDSPVSGMAGEVGGEY